MKKVLILSIISTGLVFAEQNFEESIRNFKHPGLQEELNPPPIKQQKKNEKPVKKGNNLGLSETQIKLIQECDRKLGSASGQGWKMKQFQQLDGYYLPFMNLIYKPRKTEFADKTSMQLDLDYKEKLQLTKELSSKISDLQGAHRDKNVTFLDIGANKGFYSFVAATKGAKVHAFEPQTENIKAIKQALCVQSVFKNLITVHEIGLGERQTTCKLASSDDDKYNGQIYCENVHDKLPEAVFREDVRINYLDNMIESFDFQLVLMKISVEGFEYEVLKGGIEFFARFYVPYITIEISRKQMNRMQYNFEMLNSLIYDLGYVSRMGGFKGQVISLLNENTQIELGENFILYLQRFN
eukprot:403361720